MVLIMIILLNLIEECNEREEICDQFSFENCQKFLSCTDIQFIGIRNVDFTIQN